MQKKNAKAAWPQMFAAHHGLYSAQLPQRLRSILGPMRGRKVHAFKADVRLHALIECIDAPHKTVATCERCVCMPSSTVRLITYCVNERFQVVFHGD